MLTLEQEAHALWARGLNTYDIAADIAKRWNMALHESQVCRMLYQKNGAGPKPAPEMPMLTTHQLGEANEPRSH